MNKINLNNYEAFLLDFMEGNLNKEDSAELQNFLENHPEIEAEIFDPSEATLTADNNVTFNDKLSLQKDEKIPEISKKNALIIGYIEGDLDEKENERAKSLIENNYKFRKEYEILIKAKLKPDKSVKYSEKYKLIKSPSIARKRTVTYLSLAAVLTGLIAIVFAEFNSGVNETTSPKELANASESLVFNKVKIDKKENKTELPDKSFQKENKNKNHIREINDIKTEEINTKNFLLNNIPRKSPGVILNQSGEELIADFKPRSVDELSPASPFSNLTYVKKEPDGVNFSKFKNVDDKFDKIKQEYNPIKKLREAKNDILATNAKKIFGK